MKEKLFKILYNCLEKIRYDYLIYLYEQPKSELIDKCDEISSWFAFHKWCVHFLLVRSNSHYPKIIDCMLNIVRQPDDQTMIKQFNDVASAYYNYIDVDEWRTSFGGWLMFMEEYCQEREV